MKHTTGHKLRFVKEHYRCLLFKSWTYITVGATTHYSASEVGPTSWHPSGLDEDTRFQGRQQLSLPCSLWYVSSVWKSQES